jgi:arylsulfatase A-like enzyme
LHGHPSVRTPHIDGLARDGARFTRFYVSPVCAPTRAELLTGRHHLRGGVVDVSDRGERLSPDEQTIADVLRAGGYATGCFGKWHNGTQFPYHPNARGFDEFYGFTSGHWGSYFDAPMDHNGRMVKGHGYLADDITGSTLEFMRESHARSRPFFAFLAFNTPHSPMQVPDSFWDSWDNREVPADHRYAAREDRVHTRAALAMVENIDWNVGRVLAELENLGVAENTIVVYFSDNGPNGWRWNGDLRGIKGSTDEGGVLSPGLIRWKGRIPAGTVVNAPASAMDLLPTLTGFAGVRYEPRHPLDGADLATLLTDGAAPPAGRLHFAHWRGSVSVRGDRFMLDEDGDLYDLRDDPGQTHAVTSQHPAMAAQLRDAVAAWRAEMDSTGVKLEPWLVVGHPDTELTYLPARDAQLHGGVERSNQYPNCSYIRNWRQPGDSISWDVEVPLAGRFAVEAYYRCTAGGEGSELELRLGGQALRGEIIEAWDPPEKGAEHDRVPRQESYVKDFRPLRLGTIELPSGRGTLRLHAPHIVGKTALEFRLLSLERVQ